MSWLVRLSNNVNPKAKDQFTDVGKSYEECLAAAELYSSTSRYRTIEVLEFEIVNGRLVKNEAQS